MEPRITIFTLGVSDLPRTVDFCRDGQGLPLFDENTESNAFFQNRGAWLALYARESLAADAGVPTEGNGFLDATLDHKVRTRDEADSLLATAAGAALVKPAQDTFWGGYYSYFTDTEGYLWEIAWNPSLSD